MNSMGGMFGPGMGMDMGAAAPDQPLADSSEVVYISSLALLKMLKHGSFVCPFGIDWSSSSPSIVVQVALAFLWKSWASCWVNLSTSTLLSSANI
jgi:hypothetical protein